jgi:ribosomal protein S18 acetylase RimI-like enzyme
MNIRKATINDLELLADLFEQYRAFYRKEPDLDGCRQFLADRINNNDSEIFVACNDEEKPVAFVQLYPLFSSTRMKRLWLLNDLYVVPDLRNQGVGKMLIQHSKELSAATGGCGVYLETEKSNEIGNGLYPKTGFELDTEHNYYYWS